jgi:hypothetical protein
MGLTYTHQAHWFIALTTTMRRIPLKISSPNLPRVNWFWVDLPWLWKSEITVPCCPLPSCQRIAKTCTSCQKVQIVRKEFSEKRMIWGLLI